MIEILAISEDVSIATKCCFGPCQARFKPLTDFWRGGSSTHGYRAQCKDCMRPANKAYCEEYYASGRWHARASQKLPRKARSRKHLKRRCVYVVQLLDRPGFFKIGRTHDLVIRLRSLRQRGYGRLQRILVIPCDDYHEVEKRLHAQLHQFRIYEGAKKTEVFNMGTAAGKKALASLISFYSSYVVAMPALEEIPPLHSGEEQGVLF